MMKLYKLKGYDDNVLQLYKEYEKIHDECEPNTFLVNLVMRLNPGIMKSEENEKMYSRIYSFIHEKMQEKKADEYLTNSLLAYYTRINDLKGVETTFDRMDIQHKNQWTYTM